MPTDLRNLPANFDTDATFRTWGMGIAAQLVACGLVRTADSGQINWTTVLKPSAPQTQMGYEIYRFGDALQATLPIYIKIQYGSGASSGLPGLLHSAGTNTNGAGTISGIFIVDRLSRASGAEPSVGTIYPSYCSGSASEGRIALFTNVSTTGTTLGFSIERVRDGTGTSAAVAAAVMSWGISSGGIYGLVTASLSTTGTGLPVISESPTGGRANFGSDIALFPFIYYVGKPYWSLNCLGYLSSSFTAFAPITVTHFGAQHTYMPLGIAYTGTTMAMLWE